MVPSAEPAAGQASGESWSRTTVRQRHAIDDLVRLPIGAVSEVRIVTVLSLLKSFRMDILQHLSNEWASEKETAEKAALAAAAKLEAAGYDRVQVRIEESDDVANHLIDLAGSWPADVLMTEPTDI